MITRQLGLKKPQVGALGLGCNSMSMQAPWNDGESVATIMAALDPGIMLLSRAYFYGSGHNERIGSRAIKERRSEASLSVEFGELCYIGIAEAGVAPRAVHRVTAREIECSSACRFIAADILPVA